MIQESLRLKHRMCLNIYTTVEMESQLIYLKDAQILAICLQVVDYQKASP